MQRSSKLRAWFGGGRQQKLAAAKIQKFSIRSCHQVTETDLVFGGLCVEHSQKHVAVAIPARIVGSEYFSESWRWGLDEQHIERSVVWSRSQNVLPG